MPRVCAICGKKTVSGNRVSHSHRKTRRTWSPNLQRVRVLLNGTPQTVKICTRCLRSGKVERVV